MIPLPAQPYQAVHTLFSLLPVSPDRRAAVMDRYCAQDRLYHGLYHLASMWTLHLAWRDRLGVASDAADRLTACCIAYHDCVYDARSGCNEARSAELWLDDTAEAAVPQADRAWVADSIRASQDHLAPAPAGQHDELRDWFLDLDLAMLAVPAESFALADSLVRLEYRHVPDAEWRIRRQASLRRFLDAPVLFRHPAIRALCDAAARDNLRRRAAQA